MDTVSLGQLSNRANSTIEMIHWSVKPELHVPALQTASGRNLPRKRLEAFKRREVGEPILVVLLEEFTMGPNQTPRLSRLLLVLLELDFNHVFRFFWLHLRR